MLICIEIDSFLNCFLLGANSPIESLTGLCLPLSDCKIPINLNEIVHRYITSIDRKLGCPIIFMISSESIQKIRSITLKDRVSTLITQCFFSDYSL